MNNIKYRLIVNKGDEVKDIEGIYSSNSLEQEIERQSKLNEIVEQTTLVTVTLKVRPLQVESVEDLPTAKFYTEDEYYEDSEDEEHNEYYLEDEREELDTEKSDEDMDVHEEGQTSEPKTGEE